ncbi:MAG: prolipoprotein diacylglyceryl transferase, partial [Nitrospinota bacterium]
YLLVLYRLKDEPRFKVSKGQVGDISANMMIGIIIGARLGYVIFYDLGYYLLHPLEIFLPFTFSGGFRFVGIAGMSFHGGFIGVILAAWLYIRKTELSFLDIADLFIPAIPLGYTFGRLGNFINGELYGRITTSPIGMRFPLAPGFSLRHPSQLYEAFFEGVVLFAILWSIRKIKLKRGMMIPLYLIGYGLARYFIEYFRQPDAHLGLFFGTFSMGQILSAAMILSGLGLAIYLSRQTDGEED